MKPALVFLSADRKGGKVEVSGQRFTVGRHPDRDLYLSHDIVSRHQATLELDGRNWILRDENSTNGTFVNDRKIKRQVLHDGDVIEFGLGGPSLRFVLPVGDRPGDTARVTLFAGGLVEGEPTRRERLRCLGCGQPFAVPAWEHRGETAAYVVLDDSSIPERCAGCGADIRRDRLEEMLP